MVGGLAVTLTIHAYTAQDIKMFCTILRRILCDKEIFSVLGPKLAILN